MGSEMQEKIAKAIYDAPTTFDGDQIAVHLSLSMHVEGSATDADHLRSIVMRMCMDAALAAMEAMREPTAGMVTAGGNYVLDEGGIDPMHVADRGAPFFIKGRETGSYELWQHMLDAEIEAAKKAG